MASSKPGDQDNDNGLKPSDIFANPQKLNETVKKAFEEVERTSKLSGDEAAVMKECQNESFFRRALPFAVAGIGCVHLLVIKGVLKKHPQYGSIPKSIGAGIAGYFLGKISYVSVCRQKILDQIPDSNLAKRIRGEMESPRFQHVPSVGKSKQAQDEYSQSPLPAERPPYEGLNDSNRPSMDNEVKLPDEPTNKKSTTYEDLRERNRQKFKDSQSKPVPPDKDSPFVPPPPPERRPPQEWSEQEAPKRKRTNKWGDVIDD